MFSMQLCTALFQIPSGGHVLTNQRSWFGPWDEGPGLSMLGMARENKARYSGRGSGGWPVTRDPCTGT